MHSFMPILGIASISPKNGLILEHGCQGSLDWAVVVQMEVESPCDFDFACFSLFLLILRSFIFLLSIGWPSAAGPSPKTTVLCAIFFMGEWRWPLSWDATRSLLKESWHMDLKLTDAGFKGGVVWVEQSSWSLWQRLWTSWLVFVPNYFSSSSFLSGLLVVNLNSLFLFA